MKNSLSIRAYTQQRHGHSHTYHQLVLPVLGSIAIELQGYKGHVSVGQCVVIQSGTTHHFHANESARFIVADLTALPENLLSMSTCVFSISSPLKTYLGFIENQLQHQVAKDIENSMIQMFMLLLAEQESGGKLDSRIRNVLHYIQEDLSQALSIETLAKVACLSATQFKTRFKQSVGVTVQQHITEQRMLKAKALLTHTDTPIQLIAEQVGYTDVSAFSRRFSTFYGLSPSQVRTK